MTSDFPYILNTPEMQLFLNKDINNSDKFQVEMKKLAPYNYKQISENYTKIFSEYKSEKKEDLNFDKLDTYIEYISGFVAKLNEYKKQLLISLIKMIRICCISTMKKMDWGQKKKNMKN